MNNLSVWDIPLVYIMPVIAFLFMRIPVVGKVFNVINTTIHELGHALVALVLQGEVRKIEIFSDTSGSTVTQSKNGFVAVLVALSGYPFASFMAYCSFFMVYNGYYDGFLIALSLLFLLMLVLWIRNIYGVIWVLCFCGLNFYLLFFQNDTIQEVAALFYATVLLVESVYSSFVLLFLSVTRSGSAGDAANLQKFTHVPAFIWALLFVAIALLSVYFVIKDFMI